MDISNIASMYSDKYAVAANQSAQKLQDKINSKDYSGATDKELLDACKEFEAYFVEQMYKAMLKTIPKNEETSAANETMMDYYKDQMVQGIAKETTEQSGLGLAQMLYEQMKRNYGLDTSSINSVGASELSADGK
ncbi:MAG: rod-binding protein [Acetatifactor sp.]